MASGISLDSNFSWGDTVEIKQSAPLQYKPGFSGCVCGIRIIDSEKVAREFNQEINSELYLIEFGDGESIEIPKTFLVPDFDKG